MYHQEDVTSDAPPAPLKGECQEIFLRYAFFLTIQNQQYGTGIWFFEIPVTYLISRLCILVMLRRASNSDWSIQTTRPLQVISNQLCNATVLYFVRLAVRVVVR